MTVRDTSLHTSIPLSPFFSYPSAFQSPSLRPPPRTKLANNTLGKRPRSYRYSPILTDEQCRKRPRYTVHDEHAPKCRDGPPGPQTQAAQWHQNDRFVRKFNQEELERALAVPPPVSFQVAPFPLGNDTEFPIHPIFRSLTGLMPELYPSLRLATRFLFSRQTLPFFHTLIASSLTILPCESQYYSAPITHLALSPYQATGLPETERNLTLHTMLALVPHIALQISPDPRLAVRWAYTERTAPPQHSTTGLASAYGRLPQLFPTPAQLHDKIQPNTAQSPLLTLNFRGTNTVINLSPCFLRTLHPHNFPAPSPTQKLRCAFMLAVTLLHELAHAVYMCRFPGAPLLPSANPPAALGPAVQGTISSTLPRRSLTPHYPPSRSNTILCNGKSFPHPLPRSLRHPPSPPSSHLRKAYEEHEPFYATQRKPELGHAWETTVFGGGRISSLASCDAFRVGLGWQRWPGADEFYVQNYCGEIVPLCRQRAGWGGGRLASHGGAPKWETVYVVSDAWVAQWFLRAFWDRVEAEAAGLAAVVTVEKRLGARVKNPDWIDIGDGDGWESGCSSRTRGTDGKDVVRPGQVWVGSDSKDQGWDEDGDDEGDEDGDNEGDEDEDDEGDEDDHEGEDGEGDEDEDEDEDEDGERDEDGGEDGDEDDDASGWRKCWGWD